MANQSRGRLAMAGDLRRGSKIRKVTQFISNNQNLKCLRTLDMRIAALDTIGASSIHHPHLSSNSRVLHIMVHNLWIHSCSNFFFLPIHLCWRIAESSHCGVGLSENGQVGGLPGPAVAHHKAKKLAKELKIDILDSVVLYSGNMIDSVRPGVWEYCSIWCGQWRHYQAMGQQSTQTTLMLSS